MSRILLLSTGVVYAFVVVLRARRVSAVFERWEVKAHENWQWDGLEDE